MSYVEFVGIPGSGKSTICDSVVSFLQENERGNILTCDDAFFEMSKEEMDRCYRAFLKILPHKLARLLSEKLMNRSLMQFDAQNRFLAKYGHSLSVYLDSEEFSNIASENRKNAISFFLSTGSIYETVKDMFSSADIFFSEGFVQKSFMFLCPSQKKSPNLAVIESYFANIPLPDFLIYVRADPETCLLRMRSRPRGVPLRLRNVDDESLLTFLKSADTYLSSIVCHLKSFYNMKSIEIDNSQSLRAAVEQVNEVFVVSKRNY